MTVTYGFFNSVNGDRKYDAQDFAEIFDGIIEDGIHKGIGENFFVTATGGNTVAVGSGRAWFNHTWTKSDTAVPFAIDNGPAAQSRIDAIVLEVDTSDAVRANSIKYVRGNASLFPIRPSLPATPTVRQYPLAYIQRGINASSVTQAMITNMAGTPQTPWAVSRLLDRAIEPAGQRRNVFRGKFLGTTYTTAQKATVAAGLFEDMYLGDYWTINGMDWRIVDFDYYYMMGDTRTTVHHVVVMPDRNLRQGAMNDDFFKANAGAYLGSDMKTKHLPAVFNTVAAAFGAPQLLVFRDFFTNGLMAGPQGSVVSSGGLWVSAQVELPSQIMMFGTSAMMSGAMGGNNPSLHTPLPGGQFALFRLCPWFVPISGAATDFTLTQWTRDVLSPVVWSVVSSMGVLAQAMANNNTYGFRPYFCLK